MGVGGTIATTTSFYEFYVSYVPALCNSAHEDPSGYTSGELGTPCILLIDFAFFELEVVLVYYFDVMALIVPFLPRFNPFLAL